MNYIQPNINMNTNDFGFSQINAQKQEKSFADLSFADALKAAYKNDRFASEKKEEPAPVKTESYSSEKKELAKEQPVEKTENAESADKTEKTDEKLAKKDDSKVDESKKDDKKVADAKSENDEGENVEENANSQIAAAASVKAEKTAEDVALSNADLDSKIDVSKINADSKMVASAQENAELADSSDVDVDALIKSKMADLARKNDSAETAEENAVTDNFEDLLDDKDGKIASNVAAKDKKEKASKNGFEKLNVHDLRTERKVDLENQSVKSIANR